MNDIIPLKKPKPLAVLDEPQRITAMRLSLAETRRDCEDLLIRFRPKLLPHLQPVHDEAVGWQTHYLTLMRQSPYNLSDALDKLVTLRDQLKSAEKARATFLARRQAAWQQRMDRWVAANPKKEQPF